MDDIGPRPERPGTGIVTDTVSTRPSSRRSDTARAARPASRAVIPQDQQRPMSKLARLQSAARPGTSAFALRQGSAAQRYGTAAPQGGITSALAAPVNVMDRPVTQQGMSGLRTSRTSYGQRRMVHDKTYFIGLLHTKMSEISAEIHKLSGSIETLSKEQSTYSSYEKRVKELVAELIEMQGELADYNILSEMVASKKDKSHLEEELKQLTNENRIESQRIETIYNRRREAERQVQELEEKIKEERSKAESIIQSLPVELRQKYEGLQKTHRQLSSEMEALQRKLDDQHTHKADLQERINKSELKRRAAQYEEELLEAEDKLLTLQREQSSEETPDQERERLLNQVKTNNAEISTIERQIAETSDQLRMLKEEINALEQEIEENDSDRQQKYRELKKREENMDEFMKTFDEAKQKEQENLRKLELEILMRAEKLAKNSALAHSLPEHGKNFEELRDDLEFKELEFDKAKYTTASIEQRNEALKKQMQNFENLEERMKTELKTLEDKTEQMQIDMKKYRDLDALKAEASERNSNLQRDYKVLEEQSHQLQDLLRTVQNEHKTLKTELQNNEVHRQITALEKKWVILEDANYHLDQFLKVKKAETDYEQVKKNALASMAELNTMLQQANRRM